jgi:hypothetical protein
MEATLFYFPKNGGAAKKVNSGVFYTWFMSADVLSPKAQVLPVLKKFFGTDPAKSVMDYGRSELQKAWVQSPASHVASINTLNFEE